MTEVEAYIRESAIRRGINPDVAVRVAQSEGGLLDPVRQSDFVKDGVRETSYGPFQLRIGGGLGDEALKLGIDPRNPEHWKKGVDFALGQASARGWAPWYGAAKVGIGNREGLNTVADVGTEIATGGQAPTTTPSSFPGLPGTPLPSAKDAATAAAAPPANAANAALYEQLLGDKKDPMSQLASTLAAGVRSAGGGSSQVMPRMEPSPAPVPEFTSAVPEMPAQAAPMPGGLPQLADLFKVGPVGQAMAMNLSPAGTPIIRRT